MIKTLINRILIRSKIKKISSEMNQLSYYSGVKKNDDPAISKRYDELDEQREKLIICLAFDIQIKP
jgi:hypothetical protein